MQLHETLYFLNGFLSLGVVFTGGLLIDHGSTAIGVAVSILGIVGLGLTMLYYQHRPRVELVERVGEEQ